MFIRWHTDTWSNFTCSAGIGSNFDTSSWFIFSQTWIPPKKVNGHSDLCPQMIPVPEHQIFLHFLHFNYTLLSHDHRFFLILYYWPSINMVVNTIDSHAYIRYAGWSDKCCRWHDTQRVTLDWRQRDAAWCQCLLAAIVIKQACPVTHDKLMLCKISRQCISLVVVVTIFILPSN